jgi:D-alanyl-D-alanine carboxypeptidase (penicillin-binding protein 5/6)
MRLLLILSCLSFFTPLTAHGFDTPAQSAIVYDMTTDEVLLDKNSDQIIYPASMTKLMTLYIVFEKLQQGSISLEDKFLVSEKAWKKQGSKMFVPYNKEVGVEQLIYGIATQSGNDACIVMAEGIAGSEEAFVALMNQKAVQLGLTNSNFVNSTGWPHPDHVTTAKDLQILSLRLITDFPHYYKYLGNKEYTYGGIKQFNRNPLLGKVAGVDGLKTGHTEEAGYCLASSAERNGRRVISVITGMRSKVARATQGRRLLEWAFRNFQVRKIADSNRAVTKLPVWLGDKNDIAVTSGKNINMLFKIGQQIDDQANAKIVYNHPIKAPIKRGQVVAELVITKASSSSSSDVVKVRKYPLIAMESIEKSGFFVNLIDKFIDLTSL